MSKAVFGIILDAMDGNTVQGKLQDKFGESNVLKHKDYFVLVACDPSTASRDVAIATGIRSNSRIADGVVFKLSTAHSGYTHRGLWEWLTSAEEA